MILFKNSVSFTTGVDGFGNDMWTVYMNSPTGRADLAAECPPEIVAEVIAVWGGTPTVPDPAPMPSVEPTPAQRIGQLKQQLTATDYQIIKCSECQLVGQPIPYDIKLLHTERQALRDQINELESAAL